MKKRRKNMRKHSQTPKLKLFSKPNATLFGCVAKDGEEVDGKEFEINTLSELIEILKDYPELHLNYTSLMGKKELDWWIKRT